MSPTKPGKTLIPSINIKIGNRSYATSAIEIEIVSTPSGNAYNKAPQNAYDPFGSYDPFSGSGFGDWYDSPPRAGETFLATFPEKNSAFLGEPIVVSYYLYTEQGVTSLNLTEEKDFEGYGKEIFEQPEQLEFETVSFRGRRYKRSLIKRTALIPNRSGKIQIPLMKANVRVFDFSYRTLQLSTPAIYIDIQSLPEAGKPENFSGAIGTFNIAEELSSQSISLGEAVNFGLNINGKGNFNQFIAPLFGKSPGLQISAPLVTDNLKAGIQGRRNLIYTIIPQEKGSYVLPALVFNWFDPVLKAYRSYEIKRTEINVKPANVFSYFTNFFQRGRALKFNDLLSDKRFANTTILVHTWWYWLLSCAVLVCLGISYHMARKRNLRFSDPLLYADFRAAKILKTHLQAAQDAARNGNKDFYCLAETGIMRFLAEKFKISNRLSNPEKLQQLAEAQIAADLLDRLKRFMDSCERQRYSPIVTDPVIIEKDLAILTTIVKDFAMLKNKSARKK